MKSGKRTSGAVRTGVLLSIAVVFVLVAGGTGLLYINNNGESRRARASDDLPTYRVRRGDLSVTLRARGRFSAAESQNIRCEVGGRPTITWLVEEGTRVREGDRVVELDRSGLEDQLEDRVNQKESAEEDLRDAIANEEITKLEQDARVLQAELEVQMTELEIQRFEEGTRPKELRDADIRIEQAEVNYSRARETFRRMPALLEQGFVTQEEVEQARLDMNTARNALETARLEKEILVTYTHPMQLRRFQGNLTEAKSNLQRYNKVAARQIAQAEARRRQREQSLVRAEERLEETKERLDLMTIRAPGDGIVIYGDESRRWWQDEVRVGANAHHRQVLMRLPNLDTMQVLADVHEAHFNKIYVSQDDPQEVIITTETQPGEEFKGRVIRVDTLAHGERGREYVRQFTVTIALHDQIPNIRPGMSANAEILIDRLEDVLFVPVQTVRAVEDDEGDARTYCYVVGRDGRPVARAVQTGANNDQHVAILEGLEEGERVLLRPPLGDELENNNERRSPSFRMPGTDSETY